MSAAKTIIDEIHGYTDDSPAEAVETDALSLMQFALALSMDVHTSLDRAVIETKVFEEIIYRMKRRQQEQAA